VRQSIKALYAQYRLSQANGEEAASASVSMAVQLVLRIAETP
jgi:hypothetical protein